VKWAREINTCLWLAHHATDSFYQEELLIICEAELGSILVGVGRDGAPVDRDVTISTR